MARWLDVAGILLGVTLVALGVTGAVTFHEFMFGITFWRDILIFSGVAVIGIALMVLGALDLWRSSRRRRT